jgi:hypothetical protein
LPGGFERRRRSRQGGRDRPPPRLLVVRYCGFGSPCGPIGPRWRMPSRMFCP